MWKKGVWHEGDLKVCSVFYVVSHSTKDWYRNLARSRSFTSPKGLGCVPSSYLREKRLNGQVLYLSFSCSFRHFPSFPLSSFLLSLLFFWLFLFHKSFFLDYSFSYWWMLIWIIVIFGNIPSPKGLEQRCFEVDDSLVMSFVSEVSTDKRVQGPSWLP